MMKSAARLKSTCKQDSSDQNDTGSVSLFHGPLTIRGKECAMIEKYIQSISRRDDIRHLQPLSMIMADCLGSWPTQEHTQKGRPSKYFHKPRFHLRPCPIMRFSASCYWQRLFLSHPLVPGTAAYPINLTDYSDAVLQFMLQNFNMISVV